MAVIGVELKTDQAAGVTFFRKEAVKQAFVASAAVEVEVSGHFFGLLIEDVEGTVEVVEEKTISGGARFFADEVNARETGVILTFVVQVAGIGHRRMSTGSPDLIVRETRRRRRWRLPWRPG